MQYEIVTSKAGYAYQLESTETYREGSDEKLEEKVNTMIAQGWKPLGGVSMAVLMGDESNTDYSVVIFSQAMVKG